MLIGILQGNLSDLQLVASTKVSGSPKVTRQWILVRITQIINNRTPYRVKYNLYTGDWPSGKAMGSGSIIGGSNPSSPAK